MKTNRENQDEQVRCGSCVCVCVCDARPLVARNNQLLSHCLSTVQHQSHCLLSVRDSGETAYL